MHIPTRSVFTIYRYRSLRWFEGGVKYNGRYHFDSSFDYVPSSPVQITLGLSSRRTTKIRLVVFDSSKKTPFLYCNIPTIAGFNRHGRERPEGIVSNDKTNHCIPLKSGSLLLYFVRNKFLKINCCNYTDR